MGHSPWGCKESDTNEVTEHTHVNSYKCPNKIDACMSAFFLSLCLQGTCLIRCEMIQKENHEPF